MLAEASLHEDFYLKGQKIRIRSPEPTSELALKFLRPAPAKMSILPSYIKKNLFPEYRSMPPPGEGAFKQLEKVTGLQKRSIRLDGNKKTRSSQEEEADDDEDSDGENDVEGLVILQKLIGRKYGSETVLNRRDVEDLLSARNEAEENAEEVKSLWGMLACREKVFKKTRTLSDSVAYSKPAYKTGVVAEEMEDILKIDSNYSEAIEEALNQKSRIKKNYANILEKGKQLGNGVNLRTVNLSVKDSNRSVATPDLDEEVNEIEDRQRQSTAVHKYFPKSK